MIPFRRELHAVVTATLAPLLVCPPVHALVALNDGRDRIYLTGTLSAGHDSNIHASSENRGDAVYSSRVVAEYSRRAGWIGVNGSVSVHAARFAEFEEEDHTNPSYRLEFTKQSGRTTGALSLSAARETRADAAVNVRSTSWNYDTTLHFKYPIVGLYTLTGGASYNSREYVDANALADLYTYTASVDLMRMLGAERDLMAGYRYRYNETSFDSVSRDHSLTVGVTGKVVRSISGSLRTGYQVRSLESARQDNRGTFGSWTASGALTYLLNKKTSLSAQLSKDFSITAKDSSVDVTAASLSAQYAFNSRWSLSASGSSGRSRFLGDAGRLVLQGGPAPLLGPSRADTYVSWDAGVSYSLNEHLKASASYVWFQNWSTSDYADFVRSSWTASVSSRW